jgi:hypothetical protein
MIDGELEEISCFQNVEQGVPHLARPHRAKVGKTTNPNPPEREKLGISKGIRRV